MSLPLARYFRICKLEFSAPSDICVLPLRLETEQKKIRRVEVGSHCRRMSFMSLQAPSSDTSCLILGLALPKSMVIGLKRYKQVRWAGVQLTFLLVGERSGYMRDECHSNANHALLSKAHILSSGSRWGYMTCSICVKQPRGGTDSIMTASPSCFQRNRFHPRHTGTTMTF